jgi:hypothetical protein
VGLLEEVFSVHLHARSTTFQTKFMSYLVLPVFWDPVCFQYLLQKACDAPIVPSDNRGPARDDF